MQDYCITKLIGLENVIVSNIVEADTHLEIFYRNQTLSSKLSSIREKDKVHS
jgi:hypothetical protein